MIKLIEKRYAVDVDADMHPILYVTVAIPIGNVLFELEDVVKEEIGNDMLNIIKSTLSTKKEDAE